MGLPLLAGLLTLPLSRGPALATPVSTHKGVVASAHPEASQAGAEILRRGGNAADAAAATAFALAVVEPYSSGLGGGGFALCHFRGKLSFLDFREVAPLKAHRDMYLRNAAPAPHLSRDGILAVAVPGAVAGYLALHSRYGRLPRPDILAPAIRLARDGFRVDPAFRKHVAARLALLHQDREAQRIFLRPSGDLAQPPPLGFLLVQSDLAQTLSAIAETGAATFYEGAVAAALVADMQQREGLIGMEDLNRFEVRWRQALVGSFRGHAVASSPLPSAGGQVVLTILNLMETLPDEIPWRHPDALHLYVEASKRAYADRALLGDPAWVHDVSAQLVAKDRAALLAQVIGPRATPAEQIPPGQGAQLPVETTQNTPPMRARGGHTTHLCVVDAKGNAVSMTTTLNSAWGAAVVARGTGVVWNNEMDDFAIAPGVPNTYGVQGASANAVAPGRIPLSSMAPTMVFEGPTTSSPLRLVVGSPGGPRIPTTVVQIIVNHLLYGADIETAVTLGRLHHQHLPDHIFVEPFALDAETLKALTARGHRVAASRRWSNATAIAVNPQTGLRKAAADPRQVGAAVAQE